jgi:hypothetical protein
MEATSSSPPLGGSLAADGHDDSAFLAAAGELAHFRALLTADGLETTSSSPPHGSSFTSELGSPLMAKEMTYFSSPPGSKPLLMVVEATTSSSPPEGMIPWAFPLRAVEP